MIKSYLKVALRGFRKNKLISFINIFGLGLSMSVGLMVMIRLQDQLSYDNFHPFPNRTFRVISDYKKTTGEQWEFGTSLPLHDKLQRDFSSVEATAIIYPAFNGKAISAGKEIYINGAFTEPSFFKVFGFSLNTGDPATALQKPNSIVITRSTAEKYFGTENPLGKVFAMQSGETLIITGVLNDPPGKSHIHYDGYVSFSSVAQMERDQKLNNVSSDWNALNAASTYVVLKPGYTATGFRNQLNAMTNDLNKNNKDGTIVFKTQSIGKVEVESDLSKIYAEVAIALIILVAACFNYTNLTIARALTRAKEVGIRKVTGAKRSQVFVQYIIESVLVTSFALAFAWTILSFIIRYAPFNDGYEFIPSSFRYNLPLFLWSIGFALFTALLAGASPAWILSSFKPLSVLKNLTTARIMGKVGIQKTLIVFQYSLSLTIIIFLMTFYRQFSFMSTVDPGFKKDNVLVVPLNGLDSKIASQKISQLSGVHSVSAMSESLSDRFSGVSIPVWLNNKTDALPLNYYYADPAFIGDMQLKLLAGTSLTTLADKQNEQYIVINEQASIALGFKNYQEAIGHSVWINDSVKVRISGIIKNFHYENAGIPIRPFAFRTRQNPYSYLYINTDNTDRNELKDRVNESLKTLVPSQTFSASWLDEELERNNSQAATISLMGYLAFMALSIASLGLLGLVTYTVQVKRKEISIRKIIGASEKQLIKILSGGFIKLLIIAGFIAVPIGAAAGFLFLQNFASRVSLGLPGAIACFLFLLTIGLLTIISQTYKAATANPVKDLRME